MLTELLASAVGGWPLGRVTARGGALTAPVDVPELMLDLGQPAAQVGVLRLQVGDPLLEGGEMGPDGGLGLRRDAVPERCGDRRSSSHTPITRLPYREFVRMWDGPGRPNTPSSMSQTNGLSVTRPSVFAMRTRMVARPCEGIPDRFSLVMRNTIRPHVGLRSVCPERLSEEQLKP